MCSAGEQQLLWTTIDPGDSKFWLGHGRFYLDAWGKTRIVFAIILQMTQGRPHLGSSLMQPLENIAMWWEKLVKNQSIFLRGCIGVESEMGPWQPWWLPKLFQVCLLQLLCFLFVSFSSLSLIFFSCITNFVWDLKQTDSCENPAPKDPMYHLQHFGRRAGHQLDYSEDYAEVKKHVWSICLVSEWRLIDHHS